MMSFRDRWKYFACPTVAFAFDRERLWSLESSEGTVHATATCVAMARGGRKLVAVGDDAMRLRRESASEGLVFSDYIREGAIDVFDVAEAAVRAELRQRLGSRWRMPPRVLVATRHGEVAKRTVRDVMLHAGARDVVTIPALMAGAIGAGLEVGSQKPAVIFILDQDWAGLAVIQSNDIVVWNETGGGIEQMLEDVAARARVLAQPVSDFTAMHTRFKTNGIQASDGDAGHALFTRRWRERFSRTIQSLPAGMRQEINRTSLCLIGPYAKTPGLRELFAAAWERPVVSPDEPERAVIHGCRKVLGELEHIIKLSGSGPKHSA